MLLFTCVFSVTLHSKYLHTFLQVKFLNTSTQFSYRCSNQSDTFTGLAAYCIYLHAYQRISFIYRGKAFAVKQLNPEM